VIVARVGVGREPFLDGEGIAAGVVKRQQAVGAPRTPNVRPSAAKRTSGRGVLAANATPSCREREAAPTQRRLEESDYEQGCGCQQQRPGAERGDVAHGAGQVRHPQRHHIHPFDAVSHLPPELGIEAEGNREQAKQPHRHHPGGDNRHGEQVRDDAVGRHAVEMKSRVRRRRQARDQRRDDEARDLVGAPQRGARASCRCRPSSAARRDRKPRPGPASPQI
jgi:hypothetical protein